MSEQGVTLDTQDTKDLIDLHREAEAHWEQVWDTARERGLTGGTARAGEYLAGHRWAIYVLTGGNHE